MLPVTGACDPLPNDRSTGLGAAPLDLDVLAELVAIALMAALGSPSRATRPRRPRRTGRRADLDPTSWWWPPNSPR